MATQTDRSTSKELSLWTGCARSSFFSVESFRRACIVRSVCVLYSRLVVGLWLVYDCLGRSSPCVYRAIVVCALRFLRTLRALARAINPSKTQVDRACVIRRTQSTHGDRTMHSRSSYVFIAAYSLACVTCSVSIVRSLCVRPTIQAVFKTRRTTIVLKVCFQKRSKFENSTTGSIYYNDLSALQENDTRIQTVVI